MRNRYPGTCYRCGEHVKKGAGHFELVHDGPPAVWRVQHAECAIKHREAKTRELEAKQAIRAASKGAGDGR